MKRSPLAYAVALLFSLFVLQPPSSTLAGDDESSISIMHVRQLPTAGGEDTLSEEELNREYQAARRAYEEEKKRLEREAKLEKSANELEEEKLAETSRQQTLGESSMRKTEASVMKGMREGAAKLEKAGKENCPVEDVSDPLMVRANVFSVQEALGQFGYGTGPYDGKMDKQTRWALKEYQTYNGIPSVGCIGARTYLKILDDREVLDQLVVELPPYEFIEHSWDKFVAVQGTWTVLNSGKVDPLQTTRINCERIAMMCTETTAVFERPPLTSGHALKLVQREHKIARWDAQEIDTESEFDGCMRDTIQISRLQKAVMRLRIPIEDRKFCDLEEQRELQLRLGDGLKVWSKLAANKRDARTRILRMNQFLTDLR
jgi:hypothetical protein